MRNTFVLALSALAAIALAAPAHKRDIVWVTDYTEVIETTIVMTTVYVTAPDSTAQVIPATSAVEAAIAPDTTTAVQAAAISAPAITSAAQAPAPAAPAPVVTPSVVQAPVAAAPAPEPVPASSAAESAVASPAPAPVVTPSSSAVESPAASPAPVEAPASSAAPSSSGGSSTGEYTGDITFYDVGMGSCGIESTPDENIVALSYLIMSPSNPGNPNNNPNCGKTINITYQGKTTQAKVVDTCAGCQGEGDLDMSYGLFGTVSGDDYGAGRIHGVSWSFAN